MGEWSESHSLIPYALFPDPAGYASQPHSRSFTALEEVLGVQKLPSAAKSPNHVASLTAWLKPCPCYRDARLRVLCFPWSQGRDLRPTHQDLFVGAPDLGTPFYRRVKESKCGFLGSRWSLGMRTFVYLGGRVRESNCRFLGSRWSLGMTTFDYFGRDRARRVDQWPRGAAGSFLGRCIRKGSGMRTVVTATMTQMTST
jgi:hypothetical protein